MKEIKYGSRSSKENYLKAILQLKKKLGIVHSADIAERMDVSRPSVSRAMSELQKDGLVYMSAEKHILFTEKGEQRANLVLDKYMFLRSLLLVAGIQEPVMTQEACNMEHAISDNTFLALREILRTIVCDQEECS